MLLIRKARVSSLVHFQSVFLSVNQYQPIPTCARPPACPNLSCLQLSFVFVHLPLKNITSLIPQCMVKFLFIIIQLLIRPESVLSYKQGGQGTVSESDRFVPAASRQTCAPSSHFRATLLCQSLAPSNIWGWPRIQIPPASVLRTYRGLCQLNHHKAKTVSLDTQINLV